MMESEIGSGPDRCCEAVTPLEGSLFPEAFVVAVAMVIGDEENIEGRIV